LKVTVDPGFSAWKIVPISVKVAFSDAAANTVKSPGAADPAALDDAAGFELDDAAAELDTELAAVDDAVAVVDEAVLLLELQPTTRVATHKAARVATI
jgi:hypothetical protein